MADTSVSLTLEDLENVALFLEADKIEPREVHLTLDEITYIRASFRSQDLQRATIALCKELIKLLGDKT